MFEHEFSAHFPLYWKFYMLFYTVLTLMLLSSSVTLRRCLRAALRELNGYLISFVPVALLIYALYFVTRIR